MKYCKECGHEMSDEMSVCPTCGHKECMQKTSQSKAILKLGNFKFSLFDLGVILSVGFYGLYYLILEILRLINGYYRYYGGGEIILGIIHAIFGISLILLDIGYILKKRGNK